MQENIVVNPLAARGVDAASARQMLFESQHGIVTIFEELFSAIAPIKRNGNGDIMNGLAGSQAASSNGSSSSSGRSSRTKVHAIKSDELSSAQLQRITHLAGYVTNQLTACEVLHRIYAQNDAEDGNLYSLADELKRLQELLLERKGTEEILLKKICALQQYLAIELQRSDEAKRDVEDKENEKELLFVERNELLKMSGQLILGTIPQHSSNYNPIPIRLNLTLPSLLIHSVGKGLPYTSKEQAVLAKYHAMFVEHTDTGHVEADRAERGGMFHLSICPLDLLT